MITKELVEYVKSERALLKSDDTIKQNLLTGGEWSLSDIEQAFQSSRSNNPIPVQRNRYIRITLILILIIVLIVVGQYLFSQKKSAPPSSIDNPVHPSVFNDSDLKVSYTALPSLSENSAPAFNTLDNNLLSPSDMAVLTRYIASSTMTSIPPTTQVDNIISAQPVLLKAFDENATKPYYCNLGNGEQCFLNSVRGMTYLAGTRALISIEQHKIADAQKTAANIVSLGRNITTNADTVITLLIGWVAQKTGYSILSIANSKDKTPSFSETEKNTRIAQLRNEQKKVFQHEYTRIAEGIDLMTLPNDTTTHQATSSDTESIVDEYRRAIAENPKAWNSTSTKRYFYDSYKILISNIDLPCGASLPESKIDIGFNSENKNTDNYIGKALYDTKYASLNTLNTKRCEVEKTIQNL